MTLCDLFDNYGSDKCFWHTYGEIYESLFQEKRFEKINFLEIGIGSTNPNFANNMGDDGKPGASLRAFRDYFPEGIIHGADIDSDILFEENRIKTYQVDTRSVNSVQRLLTKIPLMDIIIDDGLHDVYWNLRLFNDLRFHLKPNGIYIIEDIFPEMIPELRAELLDFGVSFDIMDMSNEVNNIDNVLAVIRREA